MMANVGIASASLETKASPLILSAAAEMSIDPTTVPTITSHPDNDPSIIKEICTKARSKVLPIVRNITEATVGFLWVSPEFEETYVPVAMFGAVLFKQKK